VSELRRQAAAIVAGMNWTTTHEEESLQAMGTEMAELGDRAARTVAKAKGLSLGYEQRDPMGWLIPLHELGLALVDAGAWWIEAAGDGITWDNAVHGRRQAADFAQLSELGEVVTAELQRSEEAEASGAVPDHEHMAALRTTPAEPPAEARHARPDYGGPAPTYRQRRRLAPFLWPTGAAALLIAAGLIYAATAGHPGTSPAAARHPVSSASIGAAGLDTPHQNSHTTPSSAPSTTARTSSSSPAAVAVASTTAGNVVAGNGGPQVAVSLVSARGNPHIQVLISVDTATTAPTTLYIAEYGTTASGQRTADDFTQRTLSGQTAYAVSYVLNVSTPPTGGASWCGDEITVEATASGGSSDAQTHAEC